MWVITDLPPMFYQALGNCENLPPIGSSAISVRIYIWMA
jgi:hypothetical protein